MQLASKIVISYWFIVHSKAKQSMNHELQAKRTNN